MLFSCRLNRSYICTCIGEAGMSTPCWISSSLGVTHTHSFIPKIQDPGASSVQGLARDFSHTGLLEIRKVRHTLEDSRHRATRLRLHVSACCLSGCEKGRLYTSGSLVILLQTVYCNSKVFCILFLLSSLNLILYFCETSEDR